MLAFVYSFILFASEGGDHAGGFLGWWHDNADPVLNYPGFEAWKFLNLAIFVGILVYLLKKPLSEAFKTKRETIRAELIRAEEEKQAALAQLTTAEAKLIRLEAEAAEVREKSVREASVEKARIAEQTEFEINKLRGQANSEIERSAQLARLELRRYSAEESIRLAEEKIRSEITAEKDSRLVQANIQSIRGLN